MNTILKNISWIFSGNLVAAFTKWLVLILIARILTPNEVGSYSLAFAFTAPITLLLNLRLRSLIVTDSNIQFKDYLYTRNLMSSIALIVIIALGLIIYPEYLFIIVLVGLSKIYDLHSELFYSIPQLNSNFDCIGKLMILKHITLIVCFSITLYLSSNLTFSLVIQFGIQLVIFYFIEKKTIEKRFSIKYNKLNYKNVKKIISVGLPLGFSVMIVSLTGNFPRYILEFFESPKILGYFSAVSYVLTVGNLIMNSVTQNFLPMLTKKLNNNINVFKKYVFVYLTSFSVGIGVITILVSYLFGELFLTFVYGQDYGEYVDVLILMGYAMAINFVSWNFDTALMSMRYISIQPKISFIVLIISVLVGIFLIKNYGIHGAAYTLIITNLIQLILRATFVVYGLKNKYS